MALTAVLCTTFSQQAFSQTDSLALKSSPEDSVKTATFINDKNKLSLQINGGTQGGGAELKFGVTNRLAVRLGAAAAPFNANTDINIDGFETNSSQRVDFTNAHLLLDVKPFGNSSGFRLVGGAAYFFKAKGNLVMTPTGDYVFGGYKLKGSDVGTLTMDVTWKGIAPYFGIGLFRSFPNKFFNINLDLGTYYLTAPTTKIVGTKLLVDNNQLEPQFNQNLKNYRWLPVLQLNFNFRIR